MARRERPVLRLRMLMASAVFCVLLLAGGDGLRAEERFLPEPPAPDFDFYVENVAPWIEENCASCHRRGGGGFRLAKPVEGLSERRRRREDFAALLPFAKRSAPWESRLFLKVLDLAEGGDDHVGGSFFGSEDEVHDTLLDFLSGATATNLAPEVWFEKPEVRAKPGEKVVIDGRGSFDRDRDDTDHLSYWWELHARPAESRVLVADRRASRLEFQPDTGGTYVFRLRVGDGKVWSAPRAVTVEVFDHVEVKQRDPGGISGLEEVDLLALRRVRRLYFDVLGRAPTPAEALAEERRGPKSLVQNILLRAESGRAWVEEIQVRFGLIGDFRPSSEDAASLALRVPSENLAPPVVEGVLARDPSFLRRHPVGRALAEAIAELLLGRAASSDELQAGMALAKGESATLAELGAVADPAEWIAKVLASRAFQRAAVRRRLERFLDSGAVDRQLGRALIAIENGPLRWRALMEEILSAPDYLERQRLRPKGALTFLRGLFIDLLERKPTDRELTALVRALATMPGESAAQAALVRLVIDGGGAPIPILVEIRDLPRWITDRFLRYLGRRPTPAELKAYGKAAYLDGGGPKLIIQALLTGPEYACR